MSESVPQANYSKLWSWTLWTHASSAHPKTVFHQPSRCSLRLQVHFELTIVCWVDKMSRVHAVSFCNLIGTAKARQRKWTTFPVNVIRLSSSPFSRREPGNDAMRLCTQYGRCQWGCIVGWFSSGGINWWGWWQDLMAFLVWMKGCVQEWKLENVLCQWSWVCQTASLCSLMFFCSSWHLPNFCVLFHSIMSCLSTPAW